MSCSPRGLCISFLIPGRGSGWVSGRGSAAEGSGHGAAPQGNGHSPELPELRGCWNTAVRPGVWSGAAWGCGLGLVALMGPFQLGIFCDCHFTVTGLFLVLHWHCGLLLVKVWSSEPLNCWRQLRALCSVAEAKHMQALLQMCAVGSGCTCGL